VKRFLVAFGFAILAAYFGSGLTHHVDDTHLVLFGSYSYLAGAWLVNAIAHI
jgi:hypothetical protein